MHHPIRARAEHKRPPDAPRRRHRRANPINRQIKAVSHPAGNILDRTARQPHVARQPHGVGDPLRVIGKAVFEIASHRQRRCRHHRPGMRQRLIAADRAIRPPQCKGMRGRRRGQSPRPQPRHHPRRSGIPRVRHHKTPRLMQLPKRLMPAHALILSLLGSYIGTKDAIAAWRLPATSIS